VTAPHAIGIDIGGTKVAGGLVDLSRGSVIARRHFATDRTDGGMRTLATAVEIATDLCREAERAGVPTIGIGIGVPELVDNSGIIRSHYNFAWTGMALAGHFRPMLPADMPSVVESDVRAAARAEMLYGAGRGRRIAVYVSVGTGISYCLSIDGRPYRGANGYAIHFASSPLAMRCPACGTMQNPVVEEIASGPALARTYAAATGAAAASAEHVLAAASSGEPRASTILADAARTLGTAIGLVVNMLDPEIVVIGGGLGGAEGPYWPAIVDAVRGSIFAEDCRDLPIVRATLGPDAGIAGAAACVADYSSMTR
jgi:glucokinase